MNEIFDIYFDDNGNMKVRTTPLKRSELSFLQKLFIAFNYTPPKEVYEHLDIGRRIGAVNILVEMHWEKFDNPTKIRVWEECLYMQEEREKYNSRKRKHKKIQEAKIAEERIAAAKQKVIDDQIAFENKYDMDALVKEAIDS